MWLLIGAVGALLFLCGLGNRRLWGAEEAYVGGIVREMADSRDWVVPTLNGHPFLEKPPMYYACAAVIARTTHSFAPWVPRLPSALFALATMVWMGWLATRLGSPVTGWWAASMVGTSDLFFRTGHTAVVDMSLAFGVSLGLGFAWLLAEEPAHGDRWMAWLWISLGLAFMAKGLIGPILVLLPLGVWGAMFQGLPMLKRLLRPQWGMLIAVALAGTWIVLLCRRGGWPYFEDAFIRNSIGRFLQAPNLIPTTGVMGEHRESVFFYVRHSPFNFLPWMFFVGGALFAPRLGQGGLGGKATRLFVPLALVVNLGFLSASSMRRAVYLLPMIPIVILYTALWLERRIQAVGEGTHRRDGLLRILSLTTGSVVCLGTLVGPWVLARDYNLPSILPACFSAMATAFATLIWMRLKERDYRAVLDGLLGFWLFALTLPIFVMPPLNEPQDRLVEKPYWVAKGRLEAAGDEVWEARLPESELGRASRILRRALPSVHTAEEIRAVLGKDHPVAVIVEPGLFRSNPDLGNLGSVVVPDDSLPSDLRRMVPYLILNDRPLQAASRNPF